MIPLDETPIYATMIRLVATAERLIEEHGMPPALPRKPLIRKGRKP